MDLLSLGLIGAAGAGGYLIYSADKTAQAKASGLSIGDVHLGQDTLNGLATGVKGFFSGLGNVGGQPQTSVGATGFTPPPPPPPPPFTGGDPAGGGQGFAGQPYGGSTGDQWADPYGTTNSYDGNGGGTSTDINDFGDSNFDYNA